MRADFRLDYDRLNLNLQQLLEGLARQEAVERANEQVLQLKKQMRIADSDFKQTQAILEIQDKELTRLEMSLESEQDRRAAAEQEVAAGRLKSDQLHRELAGTVMILN